ncbi:MAG: 3-deoxy-7-phosphoheptulonate synthase, partial [Terriglobales bacterium]
MRPGAAELEIQGVIARLIDLGFDVHRETGAERTVLACLGVRAGFDAASISALAGVDAVHRISAPYKLAAQAFRPQGTVVRVHGLE